ncbi:DUF2924 domain-containing protein [Ruegeria sp. HKCCSP351]|uniref:DUF2924 domain-containing protein n=1 Tax=Ruegeria sp. HKCCSP351 TaxID=2794832 RepID=UPI001AEA8B91|nr:DUF2924 domain-containing protein [Ruegeria sp. HKCCSP351]
MTKTSDVADLAAMGRSDLVTLWQQLFDQPAPAMLSQPFLRRFIAFEMQSRRQGGLLRQVKATLGKGFEKKLGLPAQSLKLVGACCAGATMTAACRAAP